VQLTPQKRIKQRKRGYEALKGIAIFGFVDTFSSVVCAFLLPKSESVGGMRDNGVGHVGLKKRPKVEK